MLSLDAFAQKWKIDSTPLEPVAGKYPFKLNPYFEGLIRCAGDAVWKQAVPDTREISDSSGLEDPLSEEDLAPVPNLVHRYPNRVLWLVSDKCAVHCRFCTRKRKWRSGRRPALEDAFDLAPALDYIAKREQIQDVLLSGGDPLLLSTERLREILSRLRTIKHVQIIRIGTRVPCALPSLVTPALARMLSKFHPLFVNIHFNHPAEITADSERACAILSNAGIPLGSQTVLLRGRKRLRTRPRRTVPTAALHSGPPLLPDANGPHQEHGSLQDPDKHRARNSSQTPKPDLRAGDAPFCRRSAGRTRKNGAPAQYDPGNRGRRHDRPKLSRRIVPLPAS